MTTMQCHELEQILEQGPAPLPADAATHVSACARCRGLFADLEAIETVAREFPGEVAPPEHIWVSLRAQLKEEGLIHAPVAVGRGVGWLSALFGVLPRPALAAAYLACLVVGAILLSVPSSIRENPASQANQMQPAPAALTAQLNTVESSALSGIHEHNPVVAASLRDNLALVDKFIALCEKNLREDPRNEAAREYLYGAYQQKADLLGTIMDRDARGD